MKLTVTALSIALGATHTIRPTVIAAFTIPHHGPISTLQQQQQPSTSHKILRMGLLDQLFGVNEKSDDDKKKKNQAVPTTTARDDKLKKTKPTKLTEDQVRALFSLWNDALATLDSDIVLQRYTKDAVYIPTISDDPRDSHETIKDFYDGFLLQKPQGRILQSYVTIGPTGTWCSDNGIHELTMGESGDVVKARYSFFYVPDEEKENSWKISHHHSSQMPEQVIFSTVPILDNTQVQNLFHLWNDALATKDPQFVASRYAKSAVLLSSVGDLPCTTPSLIESYFVDFLKQEPQGAIVESFVTSGTDWCQDSGIYKISFKGDHTVKARYTFVYTFDQEDGQWKISHHHSSQMPEQIQPKAGSDSDSNNLMLSEKEIRNLFDIWSDALQTKDPKKVAARYSKRGAILLPTISSDTPCMDEESIINYYNNVLQTMSPQVTIQEGETLAGKGWCKDFGIYKLTMGNGDEILARYSFVYVLEDGQWMIAHHHSSMIPELNLPSKEEKPVADDIIPTLSEKDVRELFDKWNEALATGNPKLITALYHEDALLLPTASNIPLQTPATIEDYFTSYFLKQQQFTGETAVVDETQRVILTGAMYAKDAGVYELFTMDNSNSSNISDDNGGKSPFGDNVEEGVQTRYSFVYTPNSNGEWKISHQHSSAMPEAMMEAGNKYKLIERVLFPKNLPTTVEEEQYTKEEETTGSTANANAAKKKKSKMAITVKK